MRRADSTRTTPAAGRELSPFGDILLHARRIARLPGAARHPGLDIDMLQPILHGRDPTKIIHDMLLGDLAHRDALAIGIHDRHAEQRFTEKDAFAVMA